MKRTPLKRKTPLKSGGGSMKRIPLRQVSVKRAGQMRRYWPARKAFLSVVPYCEICACRGLKIDLENLRSKEAELRESGTLDKFARSSEIHHKFSRNGVLLCDLRGFIGSCRACRDYPKDHPEEARKLGLLGKASEIGVPIDLHKKD